MPTDEGTLFQIVKREQSDIMLTLDQQNGFTMLYTEFLAPFSSQLVVSRLGAREFVNESDADMLFRFLCYIE